MKNYLFWFLLLSLIYSCSNDDDADVVGSYRLTLLERTNCADPEEFYLADFSDGSCTTQLSQFTPTDICESGTIDLSEDGTFTNFIQFFFPLIGESTPFLELEDSSGTYTTNGNVVTICNPDCKDYMFEDNTLRLMKESAGCDAIIVLIRI